MLGKSTDLRASPVYRFDVSYLIVRFRSSLSDLKLRFLRRLAEVGLEPLDPALPRRATGPCVGMLAFSSFSVSSRYVLPKQLPLTGRLLPIKIIANNSTWGAATVKPEAGDKVRVKAGAHAGERGVVEAIEGEKLLVRLEVSGLKVRVTPEQATNFSLAARKAWVTGPDRAVGRKKGTKLYDRVSVTLRFDREVWEHFLGLEDTGVIEDRTAVINRWFREKLAELGRGGHQS